MEKFSIPFSEFEESPRFAKASMSFSDLGIQTPEHKKVQEQLKNKSFSSQPTNTFQEYDKAAPLAKEQIELFGQGLQGGAEGMGIGAAQIMGLASKQQGEAHKQRMDSLKRTGGRTPGFFNPVSMGEFGGESLVTAPISGGLGGALANKALPAVMNPTFRNALVGAATGASAGGGFGALMPVGEGKNESRLSNTAWGAGAGAVVGGAAGPIAGAIQKNLAPLTERIDMYLRRSSPWSPSYPKNPRAQKALQEDRANGIINLYKMRDDYKLPNAIGEEVAGRLPESQLDYVSAIVQGKQKSYDVYNRLKNEAGDEGILVPWNKVENKLKEIINNRGYDKADREYARKRLNELVSEGPLDVAEAQQRVTNWNGELGDYYHKIPIKRDMNANIDKQVLDTYRQSLVEAVEKSSPRYAEFRKVWGSLNALEKDAVRATERELNRSIKAQDKFKFMAGEQVLYAIAKGNANYLLPAAGTWIGGKVWHHLRSPNKAIKDMFRDVAEELGPIRMTYPQPKTPEPDLWRSPLGNPNDRFPPRGDVVDTEARDLIQGGLPPVQNRPQIGFDPSKSPIPLPNGPVPTGPQVKASRLDGSIQSPPQYDPLNMTTEEILDALRKGLK